MHNPPTSGPHNGNANAVEVYVSQSQPTFFMRLLGVNYETVQARAVAMLQGGGAGCVYTSGNASSGIVGVGINGSATLDASSCSIIDNGQFDTSGKALTVNASSFGCGGTVAECTGTGHLNCTVSTACPTPNMPPAGDPLANQLTAPTVGTLVAFGLGPHRPWKHLQRNLHPSQYYGELPGRNLYRDPKTTSVFQGNSTVTGTNVTFYFTNTATITSTGTPTIHLSAPWNTGTYPGILFYQNPADSSGGPLLARRR